MVKPTPEPNVITVFVRKIDGDDEARRLSFRRENVPVSALLDLEVPIDGNSAFIDVRRDFEVERGQMAFRYPCFKLDGAGDPIYGVALDLGQALAKSEKGLARFLRAHGFDVDFA